MIERLHVKCLQRRECEQLPRNTLTGAVLEDTVVPALRRNGYSFGVQQNIGISLGGRKHRADVVIDLSKTTRTVVSVKWQQTSGTAEEKVPFEVIKLVHAVKSSSNVIPYAYLILAGTGWSLKEFYMSRGLHPYIVDHDLVRIISLDEFITRANRKQL